jgi:hypothetical protein
MARSLLKAWPALWAFAKHKNVERTSNHAERTLRSAVICRELSLDSQSEGDEQHTARLLSAHITCRLQHRSLIVYLSDALAHTREAIQCPSSREQQRTECLPKKCSFEAVAQSADWSLGGVFLLGLGGRAWAAREHLDCWA